MVDKAIKDLEEKTDSINAFDFLGLDDTNINKSQKFSLNNLGTQIGQANKVIDSDTVKIEEEITSDLGSVQKLVVQKQGIISNEYEWDISSSTSFNLDSISKNDGTNNFYINVIASGTTAVGDLTIILPAINFPCKILFDFTSINFTSVKKVNAQWQGGNQNYLLLPSNLANSLHKLFNTIKINNTGEYSVYTDGIGVKGYLPLNSTTNTAPVVVGDIYVNDLIGVTKKLQLLPINSNGLGKIRTNSNGSVTVKVDGNVLFQVNTISKDGQTSTEARIGDFYSYISASANNFTNVAIQYNTANATLSSSGQTFDSFYTNTYPTIPDFTTLDLTIESTNLKGDQTGFLIVSRGIDF